MSAHIEPFTQLIDDLVIAYGTGMSRSDTYEYRYPSDIGENFNACRRQQRRKKKCTGVGPC